MSNRWPVVWLLVACCLLADTASGQTVELRKLLTGIDCLETVGGQIFIAEASAPAVETVGYVDLGKIPDQPQSLKLIVTNAARENIPTERIGPAQWIIRSSGRVWIDARCIDLPTGFLLDQQYTLDLPIPPGPGPGPTPPGPGPTPPGPTPSPAPIPGEGLRVLIVYEQDDQPRYSPSIMSQLYSQGMRLWMNGIVTRAANGQPEWRVLDQDATCPAGHPSIWCDALKRPRSSLPWIVISNGTTGYEGPLPATEDETRRLIEAYK
jgi:hypothetical protein